MKRTILKKRSQLLQQLRAFFYARLVIEVDTPMLSESGVPDCHLHALTTCIQVAGKQTPQPYYLHTSPEYPMKRLLCQGSGDIFYLGKVFRQDALSPRHQVEFVMLEWYRLGFSMFDLMAEVAEVVQQVLRVDSSGLLAVEQLSYQQAFARYAGIENIFTASALQCQQCLIEQGVPEIVGVDAHDKALWEQLILTEVIEPHLGFQAGQPCLTFLYHYPASQAALAQVSEDNPEVAERFELFVKGIELANGYHELANAQQYRARFEQALCERKALGYATIPLDEKLLLTLAQQPLPDCSGVALGVDRLFALQQGLDDICDGIAFGLLES
ncbi:Translation elongation factor P Lys34--(R)-beta-lysine ligase [hydrothermal vent metagenome]|uniref:Translation elongation factor P Lys34--(R)-beta-lysine ligase n=1 Tax=hydrothermal vent metagenome TaxID=652676 RepID=A0A3B0W0E9_9ZZZZ